MGSEPLDSSNNTRRTEDPTPNNLQRAKRTRNVIFQSPPPLELGKEVSAAGTQAKDHLLPQVAEMTRQLALKTEVLSSLGDNLDNWVASFHGDENTQRRNVASALVGAILGHLDAAVLGRGDMSPLAGSWGQNTQPSQRASVNPPGTDAATTEGQGCSWAAVADRAKNAHSTNAPRPKQSHQAKNAAAKPSQEDLRILVQTHADEEGVSTGPPRKDPFQIRARLGKAFGLSLAKVPEVRVTRKGYAIRTADLATRDKMMAEEGRREISRICAGINVTLDKRWYTYVVPGVPSILVDLLGDNCVANAADWIHDEVTAQTGKEPVSCRPGKAGSHPLTGKGTWLVSFLEPVRQFQLFGSSGPSFLRKRKEKVGLHSPGCQGYCTGRRCYRLSRCGQCGDPLDRHPPGTCDKPAQCPNCRGPFRAGHERCPAAPTRSNGKWVHPPRNALVAIRRSGHKAFEAANRTPLPTETASDGNVGTASPEDSLTEPDASSVASEEARPSASPDRSGSTVPATPYPQDTGRPRRTVAQPSTYNVRQMARGRQVGGVSGTSAGQRDPTRL
jgi:hypothetical protein